MGGVGGQVLCHAFESQRGLNAPYWIASSNTLFECALNQINGISACDRQPLTALDV